MAAATGTAFGYGLKGLGALVVLPETASVGCSGCSSAGDRKADAVRAEQAAVELHSLLGNVRVDDVMTPDPVTVPADLTVEALIGHFVGLYRCSAFPVMSSDASPLGVVALSRLRDVPRPPQGHDHGGPGGDTLDRVVTARPGEPIDLLARFTPATGRRASCSTMACSWASSLPATWTGAPSWPRSAAPGR